jgi:hypothetical protein
VNCFMCGSEDLSAPEAWTGHIEGTTKPVTVCSEACRAELWWVVGGGSFDSARSAPLPEGAKRQKTR